MKKFSLIVAALVILSQVMLAQEAALKNFRFGLKVAPVFTWMKPDDVKQFSNNGVKIKFNFGLITEFKLTKTAAFCTGFDFNTYGGKIDYKNSTTRYYVAEQDRRPDSVAYFNIASRSYKMQTYELPITLKLRTPEIGSLTYFGQFGVNLGFRGKVKSTDVGKYVSYVTKTDAVTGLPVTKVIESAEAERPDNIITDDLNPIRLGLNAGIGAEYNLAGSTSLVVSINYYNAFLNTLKGKSKYLETLSGGKYTPITQNVKSNALVINIGFMF